MTLAPAAVSPAFPPRDLSTILIGRGFRFVIAVAMVCAGLAIAPVRAQDADVLSRDSVLRDAEIPAMGNRDGDITIVEWFDYQCPYCKKLTPDLAQVVKDDGKIRLVMKDWPILGPPSDVAARLVLATRYQDKYQQSHQALMAAKGRLTESRLRDILSGAGVDLVRADADLAAHRTEIDALLKRNNAQAEAFGFQGTPAFIIGTFRVPGVLDAAMFKRAVADARAAAAKAKK
jgi:protein-disulfide isomerase